MSTKRPIAEKLPSNADYDKATSWSATREIIAAGDWYWLATQHPAERPHVRPVLGIWMDEALYFCSNENARKAKNLQENVNASIAVADNKTHLVIEGQAVKVTDENLLRKVAEQYASKYDWHVIVLDGAYEADYGAPTAGPSPYDLYELRPERVYGFGTSEKYSPTRWRF
jgi:uncharacterized pyridoxamine 5'-phosphate oxidase family protein